MARNPGELFREVRNPVPGAVNMAEEYTSATETDVEGSDPEPQYPEKLLPDIVKTMVARKYPASKTDVMQYCMVEGGIVCQLGQRYPDASRHGIEDEPREESGRERSPLHCQLGLPGDQGLLLRASDV